MKSPGPTSRLEYVTRRFSCAALLSSALLSWPAAPAHGASAYAGEFLAVGAGARGLALGSACVALGDAATAGYWNSAGLAGSPERQAHFTHGERFNGLVRQDYVAFVTPGPYFDGLGIGLLRLGVDGIHFTDLPDPSAPLGPDNRPFVSSTESAADYALYLSAGRRLGERLDIGASAKLIHRSVADLTAYGGGLDLGLRYRPAPSLTLAANIRDVTTTPILWDGTTDRIRPSILLGVAYGRALAGGTASVAIGSRSGGDAEDEAGTAPVHAGIEYDAGRLALRAGLEELRQTFGVGLRVSRRLQVDLAYLQHDDLEGTYLLSADVRF